MGRGAAAPSVQAASGFGTFTQFGRNWYGSSDAKSQRTAVKEIWKLFGGHG